MLYPRGREDIYPLLNTQGYGYAIIGPDGKTIDSHLHLPEAEKILAKTITKSPPLGGPKQ